ncbi:CoA-binding protein [Aquamicrobium soli]|jgi:hypothetical protein|uniref:CoA-binding protein n=1 Tax=Aquamicrobium soli TaxID=1811518 RepID=A0ABV7KGQ3_9HYPH
MSASVTVADRDVPIAPRHRLDPLLEPQSIAFVGASERPDTPGSTMILSAAADGYQGRLYPVNPNRSSVHGLTCYPDLTSLPERVDHVVIGTADTMVEADRPRSVRLIREMSARVPQTANVISAFYRVHVTRSRTSTTPSAFLLAIGSIVAAVISCSDQ